MQQKAVLEGRIRKFNEEAEVARWVEGGLRDARVACMCLLRVWHACACCVCGMHVLALLAGYPRGSCFGTRLHAERQNKRM